MVLDNENKNLKVHEWISKYTEEGSFDILTGYFTIGALAFLSKKINVRIKKFRMVKMPSTELKKIRLQQRNIN